jgi:hypothetical protein
MLLPKFAVGDHIRLASRALLRLASNGTYQVEKVMTGDETEIFYRVKAWDEPFSRTIPEHEISLDQRAIEERLPFPQVPRARGRVAAVARKALPRRRPPFSQLSS